MKHMSITFEDVTKIFERIDGSGGLTDAMKSDLNELKTSLKSMSDENTVLNSYKEKYDTTLTKLNAATSESTEWKEKYSDLAEKYSKHYGQATDPQLQDPDTKQEPDEYALHSKNNPTTLEELFFYE